MALNDTRTFSRFSNEQLATIAALRWSGSDGRKIAASVGIHYDHIAPVIAFMDCADVKVGRPCGASQPLPVEGATIDAILAAAADEYAVSVDDICGPSRIGDIVLARQAAMWRLRDISRPGGGPYLSLPQIARILKRGDHTTVLHGIRQHEKRRQTEAA